jgi:hypothetical protein
MLYFLIKVQYLLCSDFSDLIDGKGFNANKETGKQVLDGSNCKLTKARTQKSTKKRKEKQIWFKNI